MGGIQICLAGLGTTEEPLTFPAHWDVKQCLDAGVGEWIRFSTAEEMQATPAGFVPKYWQQLELEHVPRGFIYSNGTPAEPGQPLGLHGSVVTAVVSTAAPHNNYEEKACVSLADIPTPPTPV